MFQPKLYVVTDNQFYLFLFLLSPFLKYKHGRVFLRVKVHYVQQQELYNYIFYAVLLILQKLLLQVS